MWEKISGDGAATTDGKNDEALGLSTTIATERGPGYQQPRPGQRVSESEKPACEAHLGWAVAGQCVKGLGCGLWNSVGQGQIHGAPRLCVLRAILGI